MIDEKIKTWSLYIHILKNDPTKVYIGITSQQPKKRWDCGRGYVGCPKMKEAIQNFGWDAFEHKVLFTNLNKEEAEKLEKQYIIKYNSINNGFNTSPGGHLLSEESIKKMSDSLKKYYKENGHPWTNRHHTEETKEKLRQCHLGLKVSEEARKKISEAHLGRKQSKEWIEKRTASNKKRILCIQSDKIYNGAKECCIAEFGTFIKGTANDIRAVCRGERYTCKGKHFKYIDEEK